MSASAIEYKTARIKKTLWVYIGITAFCAFFSAVYEHFSHGVNSNAMIWLFAYPFVGGVLMFGLLGLIKKAPFPGRVSYNLYNSGIATLAAGSCFTGVLEIYGTTSNLSAVYWIAGIFLTGIGILLYLIKILIYSQ